MSIEFAEVNEELSYEKALEELKQIVSKLERGDVHLEETTLLYQKGQKMLKICHDHLNKAKGKLFEVAEGGMKQEIPN